MNDGKMIGMLENTGGGWGKKWEEVEARRFPCLVGSNLEKLARCRKGISTRVRD